MQRRRMLAMAGIAAALTLAGCGQTGGTNVTSAGNGGVSIQTTSTVTTSMTAPPMTSAMPMGTTTPGSSEVAGATVVKVDAGDYYFHSTVTTFKVGVHYHFEVNNPGNVAHEIMVVKPIPAGAMDMDEMDKMALAHIEADDLQPGANATTDVTFDQAYPPGTLELACHVAGHYEKGMRLPIDVQP